MLDITRQAFNKYLKNKDKPWKYNHLADMILTILKEDECNDRYGRVRMVDALKDRFPNDIIPSEQIVDRVMKKLKINHFRSPGPKGITRADKEARKSEDLLRRNFYIDRPYTKLITDITEIPCKNKKIYVSVIFDCFNLKALGIAIRDYETADLVIESLENAYRMYPQIRGAILHSDRGTQYTSKKYREKLKIYGIIQSMNSDGGRCHDNARCEAMWARMKEEQLYHRYNTKKMDNETVKQIIWRYYMSYWNNRSISTALGVITPIKKEQQYYKNQQTNTQVA